MQGLKRGTVQLFPHDPQWDEEAAETIARLCSLFGSVARQIEHVGSTSVPTISAKPILDVAVGVTSFEEVVPLFPKLDACGFHPRDGAVVNGEIFLSCGDFEKDTRTHHIHVIPYGGKAWFDYLLFRDALRKNPSLAKEYEALKLRLLAQFASDRTAYTEGKAAWIQSTLRRALREKLLGCRVRLLIDRPLGSVHPNHPDLVYPVNYGYLPEVWSGDGEEADVYLLGVEEPVESFVATVTAVVCREDDVEDKFVACPEGVSFSADEIRRRIDFQEQYFHSHLILASDVSNFDMPPNTRREEFL